MIFTARCRPVNRRKKILYAKARKTLVGAHKK